MDEKNNIIRVNNLMIDAYLNKNYIKMENYRILLNHLIDKILNKDEKHSSI